MLHIFHGDNTVVSRKELSTFIEKHSDKEKITLSGKNISLTMLHQALESNSLFGSDRLVIIEGLLSSYSRSKTTEGSKKNNPLEEIIEILLPTSHTVVLWEDKEIGKLILKKFPDTVDRAVFPIRRNMFSFLGNVAPGKPAALLASLQSVLQEEAPEMLFYMLVRQVRLLLLAAGGATTGLASWQESKLLEQAKRFTPTRLYQLYTRLLLIDKGQKTGTSPFSLTSELRQFLIEL